MTAEGKEKVRLGMRMWLMVMPLVMAGCATELDHGGEVEDLVAEAGEWDSASESGTVDGWLTRLGDAELSHLVAETFGANPGLRAAVARLEQAVEVARIEGADRLPDLSLTGSAQRQMSNNGFEPVVRTRSERFGVNAVLSWEVDLWGRVRAQSRAATADAEAAALDLAGVRLSLATRVGQAWYLLIERKQQARLAEETLRSFESNLSTVEERFRRGLSPALDVRLTRATVANARATFERQRRLEDVAQRQLEVLAGRYPAGQLAVPAELPRLSDELPAGLSAQLLERRPDLLGQQRRLMAADARLLESRRSLLPRISLTASYGRASAELEDIVNDNFDVWNLLGGVTAPLFQGGRLRANTRRLEARLEELLASYREAALTAFQEVESGLLGESTLRSQLVALETAAEEFAGAEQLAIERYERGLVDILTVLESQRSAFNARSAVLSVENELLQNRLILYRALGGDIY